MLNKNKKGSFPVEYLTIGIVTLLLAVVATNGGMSFADGYRDLSKNSAGFRSFGDFVTTITNLNSAASGTLTSVKLDDNSAIIIYPDYLSEVEINYVGISVVMHKPEKYKNKNTACYYRGLTPANKYKTNEISCYDIGSYTPMGSSVLPLELIKTTGNPDALLITKDGGSQAILNIKEGKYDVDMNNVYSQSSNDVIVIDKGITNNIKKSSINLNIEIRYENNNHFLFIHSDPVVRELVFAGTELNPKA